MMPGMYPDLTEPDAMALPPRPPLAYLPRPVPAPAMPPRRSRLRSAGMGTLYLLMAALCIGIAALTFASIYHTVTTLLRPSMRNWARAVPVAVEITFVFLFVSGVILAIKRKAAGAWRPLAMALIMTGSLLLNVWAFRHNLAAAVGHLMVVVSFFIVLLGAKSFLMALAGGKVRGDGIPLGEWTAHPVHSARLWRWRQGWGEPSLEAARRRYLVLLYVTAIAQADERIGTGRGWRGNLPVTLRYELSTGLLPSGFASGYEGWQEIAGWHVEDELSLLPPLPGHGSAQGGNAAPPEEIAPAAPEAGIPALPRQAEGSLDGSEHGSTEGTDGGSGEGSSWPERKELTKAELTRRVKAAIGRYERANEGRRLPAYKLSEAIQVRMGRDTAGPLLREVYAAVDAQRASQ
jgi:hypothetical protein